MTQKIDSQIRTKLKHYRISEEEYQKICELLGRPPLNLEWALFSALWSEHCSYKSSKIHLKKFAETLDQSVLNATGENAGVVDLGQGERIVFKMESHNHPSYIEPYQGAATGVGGILRDIFTMGARPIALADYLCFGRPQASRMGELLSGVVHGISGYGNSVGVPTVSGQTNFDESYNQNILVNAMAVGLLRKGEVVALSAAKGPGNFVVYVGAKTGRDGVHGAAMASESFDENSESKKPNVQIGDPYFEKLLIESCLEILQKNLVVAIQDMGAAGLTSSSFEMASKGQVGMKINLDKIPVRDSSILPEEILLSESQERMLLICEPQKFAEIQQIFSRWGLDAVCVGEVVKERQVELWWKNEKLSAIDPDILVENCPQYKRPFVNWKAHSQVDSPDELPSPQISLQAWLMDQVSSVNFCDRDFIYRQYDQRVGVKTVRGADHDVAILRLPDSNRGLAMAVGCRPGLMKLDAQLGAYDAVFYPSFQMSIKGAKPVALTDCLNFGNPEKIEIMSEFVASVEAIKASSKILHAPVISGNVSFYNETLGRNITSTPAIGVVGLRSNVENIPEDHFVAHGNLIYRISCTQIFSLGIVAESMNAKNVFFGEFDLAELNLFMQKLRDLSGHFAVKATQMVGRGGLLVSLLRMCHAGCGFKADREWKIDEVMHENFYQTIWEVDNISKSDFEKQAERLGLKFEKLGVTQKDFFEYGAKVKISLGELAKSAKNGMGEEL